MAAVRRFDPALIPWVAGVLETRGYLSERPSGSTDKRLPTVAVSMRDLGDAVNPVIGKLCEMTDVEPITLAKKFNRAGCGTHCPEPHIHVTGVYHRWIIGGVKAVIVLRATLPYLLVQHGEAERLIRLGRDGNWKRLHVQYMANLGWPVDDVLSQEEAPRRRKRTT